MKKSSIYLHFKSGFTLIEMLIVMAILALLLTIALPRYFGALEKSREATLKQNLKVLRVTLDKFYSDKGRYPDVLQELVEYKYLSAVPIDPITESNNSWILLQSQDAEIKGVIDIKSGAQGVSKDGQSYESF
jgi:general secretion pathway protein G